jgi:hypothetical protein
MLLHFCKLLPVQLGNDLVTLAKADQTMAAQFQSIHREGHTEQNIRSAPNGIDQVRALCVQQWKNKNKGKLLLSNQNGKEASGHN